MELSMPLKESRIEEMGALHRKDKEQELGIRLAPLTLVINKRASTVGTESIRSAFLLEMGSLDRPTTIHRYAVDPAAYYEAYYASSDNQMSPIAVVKVWYSQA